MRQDAGKDHEQDQRAIQCSQPISRSVIGNFPGGNLNIEHSTDTNGSKQAGEHCFVPVLDGWDDLDGGHDPGRPPEEKRCDCKNDDAPSCQFQFCISVFCRRNDGSNVNEYGRAEHSVDDFLEVVFLHFTAEPVIQVRTLPAMKCARISSEPNKPVVPKVKNARPRLYEKKLGLSIYECSRAHRSVLRAM
jgi:hypothetical protein